MSRSNTNYYNVCGRHWPIEEDGYCWVHRPGPWKMDGRKCIPARKWETRRGLVERKPRFSRYSAKSWHHGPPASIKQIWHKQARAAQRAEFLHNPDDPVITPMKRLINLWDWY